MQIAIISDVHDNIANLKKVLDYCKENNVSEIICCGDLATIETLDFINDNFSGKILFTFGNMDQGHISSYPFTGPSYKNTLIFSKFGETIIKNKKIAFVHFPEIAKQLCQTGNYDMVFYGHTHKPWEEMIDSCKMLNPGNVANQIYPPSFALWNIDNDLFRLIRINELS